MTKPSISPRIQSPDLMKSISSHRAHQGNATRLMAMTEVAAGRRLSGAQDPARSIQSKNSSRRKILVHPVTRISSKIPREATLPRVNIPLIQSTKQLLHGKRCHRRPMAPRIISMTTLRSSTKLGSRMLISTRTLWTWMNSLLRVRRTEICKAATGTMNLCDPAGRRMKRHLPSVPRLARATEGLAYALMRLTAYQRPITIWLLRRFPTLNNKPMMITTCLTYQTMGRMGLIRTHSLMLVKP